MNCQNIVMNVPLLIIMQNSCFFFFFFTKSIAFVVCRVITRKLDIDNTFSESQNFSLIKQIFYSVQSNQKSNSCYYL